ncbi:hypothetical protein M422DRAFT_256720 [Sphaerobolus stellatus SS14]|uniref:Uncharacterized protein n=1 Tax=Sphaerobolus stellatus (strain SS14) TaxID=990650 RepID=A0A0C9UBD3_SPHS4|nr:hypothetical protein M422DRAFT_256720 [Sphaerobolus stellatus SS14]
MSGTKQYIAHTSPALVELDKPSLNVSEECVMQEAVHLQWILDDAKLVTHIIKLALFCIKPLHGCNLVHSMSSPSNGNTLSGLAPVPKDSFVGQPKSSICYASLDPNQGNDGTLAGTPNPLGGGSSKGPPPGGGPPVGGPNPDLNPGPDPGDRGGPPDDEDDKALN